MLKSSILYVSGSKGGIWIAASGQFLFLRGGVKFQRRLVSQTQRCMLNNQSE